jgi:hypothetical protein
MVNATTELIWFQALLRELQIASPKCARLWCDNMGAKYLSSNQVFHGCIKHIEIDYHFVHDQVLQRRLDVRFISTQDQLADGFTKVVPLRRLLDFRGNLNLVKL